jgi:hypothetical protein
MLARSLLTPPPLEESDALLNRAILNACKLSQDSSILKVEGKELKLCTPLRPLPGTGAIAKNDGISIPLLNQLSKG